MGLELADLAVDGCITEIPLAVQSKREAARRIGKIGVKRPAVVNAKGILLWRRQALHLIGARGEILQFHTLYQPTRRSGPLPRVRRDTPQQRLAAELLAKRRI